METKRSFPLAVVVLVIGIAMIGGFMLPEILSGPAVLESIVAILCGTSLGGLSVHFVYRAQGR